LLSQHRTSLVQDWSYAGFRLKGHSHCVWAESDVVSPEQRSRRQIDVA